MIDVTEQTTGCPHCGRPVQQTPHKRRKVYCNDVCQQLAYRKRKAEKAREAQEAIIHTRWSGYLPETQQVLRDIMHLSGEELTERVNVAINAEVERRVNVEERYRTDIQVRHFKSWLRRRRLPQDADFLKLFLDDTRLPHHASRSMYIARLKQYGYTAEDIAVFEETWKDMLFSQS